MPRFTPGGRPHTVLLRLNEGPSSYLQLADDLGNPPRRKTWHILGEMLHCELLGGGRQRYYILAAGRDMLMALDAGREVVTEEAPRPNIRVFA